MMQGYQDKAMLLQHILDNCLVSGHSATAQSCQIFGGFTQDGATPSGDGDA
jgi:hypothetical protein